jgi:hypothetical protein
VSAGRDGEEEQGSVSVPVKKAERFCVRGTNLTEVKVVVDRVSAGHHESDHVEHGRGAASLDVGLPVLVLCLLNREGHAGGERNQAPEPLLPAPAALLLDSPMDLSMKRAAAWFSAGSCGASRQARARRSGPC